MQGVALVCELVQQLAAILHYELPFDWLKNEDESYFWFLGEKVYVSLASSLEQSQLQRHFCLVLTLLFGNILSLCESQHMHIKESDARYALFMLLKLAEPAQCSRPTLRTNLSVAFAAVRNAVWAALSDGVCTKAH